MPFVQMENISHFLRACQSPPLNLHEHDIFLTVDLYEQKDPAQVLQCLGAFSRAANSTNPRRFPDAIGPKSSRAGNMSPHATPSTPSQGNRGRGTSVNSNTSSAYGGGASHRSLLPSRTGESASGRWSPTKSPAKSPPPRDTGSPGPVSTWSKKSQENTTSPAWNVAQYGYMGGASQGNLGIQFGGRRQIINSGPQVPSLAEKEKQRKEQEAEEERQRQEAEDNERQRVAAEEEQAKREEEQRWEEETTRLRRKADEERRRWEDEERQWKLTEEKRRKEEAEADARLEEERKRARSRSRSPVKLRGQFLSQYQSERAMPGDATDDSSRIRELEKELERARQREAEYERERQGRGSNRSSVISGAGILRSPAIGSHSPAIGSKSPRARSRSRPRAIPSNVSTPPTRQDSWQQGEREVLQTQWDHHHHQQQQQEQRPPQQRAPEPEPEPPRRSPHPQAVRPPPSASPRPLPDPGSTPQVKSHNTGGSRPLPDPATYHSPPTPQNRTGRFLAHNPPAPQDAPQPTYSREVSGTQEYDAEDRRRVQSQAQTKAGGSASKSLLEREMERERERQREWEESQRETQRAVPNAEAVEGIGGRWDVGQWNGYTGGDTQNRGSKGIGAGRRQIVGPRPLPGSNR